jgi:hypothetical protein
MIGLAAALALFSGGLLAQQEPKPAPEMSQLAYFEGTWSCSGKSNESPFGPAGPITGAVEIRRDLGGFWQSGVVKATMPKQPPFEGRFHVTYNPGDKQFVMLWVDSVGGWSKSSTSGWKGDTLSYEGDAYMGPQTFKSRDTFTRSGAGSLKHTWEAQINGKWTPLGEETCTKKK